MKRGLAFLMWTLCAVAVAMVGVPLLGPALGFASYRAAVPPQGDTVTLHSGQHLNVITQCDGNGDPLVLVHGLPGGAAQTAPLARALCDRGFRTLYYDRMGWGRSSARGVEAASFEQNARELLELLDILRIDRAVLVGYSYGGGVVQELARLAPRRVGSAVLLASVGPARKVPPTSVIQNLLFSVPTLRWALSSRFTAMAAAGRSFEALFHPDAVSQRDVDAQLATLALGDTAATWVNESIVARHEFAKLQPVHLQQTPVLILHGSDDQIVAIGVASDLHHALPHARFEQLPGAGHGMVMTRPAAVADRISAFLNEA